MKIENPICPWCQGIAVGLCSMVPCVAAIAVDADGIATFTGDTDVEWDDQWVIRTSEYNSTVVCDKKHRWHSPLIADDYDDDPGVIRL
jgi:hypothetical protein